MATLCLLRAAGLCKFVSYRGVLWVGLSLQRSASYIPVGPTQAVHLHRFQEPLQFFLSDKQYREMAQILVPNDGIPHMRDLRQISKHLHDSVASTIIIFKAGLVGRVK